MENKVFNFCLPIVLLQTNNWKYKPIENIGLGIKRFSAKEKRPLHLTKYQQT
jgi:hypothetical protein